MATCPRGHDSTTLDYCDQCGTPMAARNGSPVSGTPAAGTPTTGTGGPIPATGSGSPAGGTASGGTGAVTAPTGRTCPVCGTTQAGRFCEEDGYDFMLAPPVPVSAAETGTATGAPTATTGGPGAASAGSGGDSTATVGGDPSGGSGESAAARPVGAGLPTRTAPVVAGPALMAVVAADRAWYDTVVGMGGEDAGGLSFPRFVVERRFPLRDRQLLIGRASRSRGVYPDIDLAGPPEDPGVSHTHALLMAQPEGWAVVDLQSANGTYVNDPESAPIPADTPVPVQAGDRIFVGAWTCLSIRELDGQTHSSGP